MEERVCTGSHTQEEGDMKGHVSAVVFVQVQA